MSINTTDEQFRKDMDNASSIKERFNTLKELHKNGIYTILFMSPIFPYITDWQNIIEESKSFINEYWFENLNLRGDYKKVILDYVKNNDFKYYNEYQKIYEDKDKKYWIELSSEIDKYCIENNIKYVNYFYHEDIVKR
jgi:DNA repair photolyase